MGAGHSEGRKIALEFPPSFVMTSLIKRIFNGALSVGTIALRKFDSSGYEEYYAPPTARTLLGFDGTTNPTPGLVDVSKYVSFSYTIATQGDTGAASSVQIYMVDLFGNNITGTTGEVLRVRVCNSAGWTDSTNATIAAGANTTAVSTLSSNKDYLFTKQADFWTITLTDATAETVTLRVGHPTISGYPGDYSATQNVTHAAP